ncbi:MAG: ABC transporter ATP-binding protein, partial [Oscillospiraceae bacterium]|nr:ABC transporter ATP-binding protein [Oscillospiraceae bacterium]
MIEVKNLTKYYGSNKGVENVSFTIEKGEIVGLLGPNGAGKSTIMKMINGYFPPTSGTITVGGYDVVENPREAAACIGFLPEIPPLYVEMPVEDFLMFIAKIRGVPRAERKEHIAHVMELANITHVRDRLIKNLSKGYRQRVGLAQALVNLPEILILDEPTVGLDPKQITEVRDLIKELSKEHTVILSSHILSEVNAICEKIIIINRGQLVTVDTVEHLERGTGRSTLLRVKADPQRVQEVLG